MVGKRTGDCELEAQISTRPALLALLTRHFLPAIDVHRIERCVKVRQLILAYLRFLILFALLKQAH